MTKGFIYTVYNLSLFQLLVEGFTLFFFQLLTLSYPSLNELTTMVYAMALRSVLISLAIVSASAVFAKLISYREKSRRPPNLPPIYHLYPIH